MSWIGGGLAAVLAAAVSAPAYAGFVDLDGGWRATWDDSLDGLVDVNSLGVVDGALFIQKSAEFTQPSVGGIFPSIPIVFSQTEYGAASKIVIDDEIIFNNTGEDWTDFHIDLLDGGDVVFDPVATMNSGGGGPIGWTIDPFTGASFTPDLMRLDIYDGVVEAGDFWFPGNGATNGQLWIDVNVAQQGEEFTTFVLKETPTGPLPAPGALALLGVAAFARRRRRS
ncbi:MAG: hypothetical protein ACYTGP_09575 [Planctomycetota bacterium]|jgi:MYXO-CTERM domain-containing protein